MAEPVNIPNLDGLVALANRDGVDIKPTLLRVTTDLYVQKPHHSPEEERHYVELALRLIEGVDAATRAAVEKKLAAYGAPPAPVLRRLQRDRHRPERAPMSRPAVATEPARTAADELNEMFFAADAETRRLILDNLEYAVLPPARPIAPGIALQSSRRLEAAALSHDIGAFAREIERTLEIAPSLARRLIDDESGEPIVVAARALAMPADMLQRILLCLNPAISQSVLRVYELARLYEHIEQDAALRLVVIWRAGSRPAQRRETAPAIPSRRDPTPQSEAHQPHPRHVEERPAPPARPRIRWDDHAQVRKVENQ
jgi:hypothetical protein